MLDTKETAVNRQANLCPCGVKEGEAGTPASGLRQSKPKQRGCKERLQKRRPRRGLWGTVGKAASGNGTHMAPGHQSREDVLRNREGMGHGAEGLGLMPMMIVISGRGGDASLIGRV